MEESAKQASAASPSYPITDDEKMDWLRAQRVIRYPTIPPAGIDDDRWRSMRTIRAEMLTKLFEQAKCTVPVRLHHVIIEDDLRINYAICPFEFSVKDSEFSSEVDFSYMKFDGVLDISDAVFTKRFKADFGVWLYDFQLEGAAFHDEASFKGISVGGRLIANGALFKGRTTFAGMRGARLVSFRSQLKGDVEQTTTFETDANFLDSRVDGSVEFDGAQFGGKLDFGRAAVLGNLLFRPAQFKENPTRLPVRVKGSLSLIDSSVGGSAIFDSSEFDDEVNCQRARFGRGLYFREVKFGSKARALFNGLQCDGPLVFEGAQFESSCSFDAAQIKGSARFRSNLEKMLATRFGSGASFRDVVIAGNANFAGATFWSQPGQADQPAADFSRITIGGSAFFNSIGKPGKEVLQARFMGKAVFDDISVHGICNFSGTHFSDQLQFRRAQIGSGSYFGNAEIDKKFVRTHFGGFSNFRECRFRGTLDFSGAYFAEETSWDRSVVDGAAFFRPFFGDGATTPVFFGGKASFRDVQISGIADFSGTNFNREANFTRAKFGNGLFLSTLLSGTGGVITTQFHGVLKLFRAQIAGDLQMEGTEHDELADLESVSIKGNLLCRAVRFPEVAGSQSALLGVIKFKKGARFLSAVVDGAADFSESEFGSTANFVNMKVGGPTVFRTLLDSSDKNKTTFQKANFNGAVLSGGADFEGVHFAKSVSFVEMRIAGTCRFSRVKCDDHANFSRCEVQGDAYFDRDVIFERITFEGARFGKQCLFNGARFPNGVDFSRVRVDGLLSFAGAVISGRLSLEDSTVSGVLLELEQSKSALKEVILKGFSYGTMRAQWKELFKLTPDDRKGKADLQPYTQLEKYFRSVGYDRDADDVYLARRKKEWKFIWDQLLRSDRREQRWIRTFVLFLEGVSTEVCFQLRYCVISANWIRISSFRRRCLLALSSSGPASACGIEV